MHNEKDMLFSSFERHNTPQALLISQSTYTFFLQVLLSLHVLHTQISVNQGRSVEYSVRDITSCPYEKDLVGFSLQVNSNSQCVLLSVEVFL